MEELERRSCPATLVGGEFGWALEIGLIGSSDSHRVASDTGGNVYVAGGFFGTHDFDPGPATVVLSSYSDDVFLAKLNSQGQLQWLRQFGGEGDDRVNAITVDLDGNITLVGTFHGSADFDPGTGTAILAGESGYSSVYVVQLSSDGDFRWATQFDGPGDDEAAAVVADKNGNLLVAGIFASNCDFDPGPGVSVLDVNTGNRGNNFVVSLTTTGAFRWARQYTAFVSALAFDSVGSAVIGGTFYAQMEVDPTNPANRLVSGNYGSAAFVLKLTPGGDFSWARHMGGLSGSYAGRATGLNVALDSEDNIILGGYFVASVGFDSGVAANVLNSRGQTDAFLLKWSSDGLLLWLRDFGASGYDRVGQVAVLADDTVAVVGEFEFTVDFDSGPSIEQLTSVGRENSYVLGLTKDGAFGWVRQFGGTNATTFTGSIATLGGQDLLLAGSFVNTISVLPEGTSVILRPREAGTSINGGTSGGDRASAGGYWGGFAMLVKVPDTATAPSAPLALAASPMESSVQLSWAIPESDGGAAISDYLIQYSSDSGLTWETFVDGASTLMTAAVTGLVNGSGYLFRVAAVNRIGAGDFSLISEAVVPGPPPLVFSVPRGAVMTIEGLSGDSRIVKQGLGTLILDRANSHTGGTVVEAGVLVVRDPASLGSGPLTALPGVKITVDVGAQQVPINGLELSAASTLDLATGSVRIDSESRLNHGEIIALIARDSEQLSGIVSSSIQPGNFREIGYRVLADGSLQVGYSAIGDANIDGSVNVQDLIAIDAGGKYGSPDTNAGWWQGDFNHDGRVNIADLIALDASGLYGAGSYVPVAPQVAAHYASPKDAIVAVLPATVSQDKFARVASVASGASRVALLDRESQFVWAAIAQQRDVAESGDRTASRRWLVEP